jgi:hypothetical protein
MPCVISVGNETDEDNDKVVRDVLQQKLIEWTAEHGDALAKKLDELKME